MPSPTTTGLSYAALDAAGQLLFCWLAWYALEIPFGLTPGLFLAGWTVGFVFSGPAMTMPFTMLSDAVDYGEWRCGVRAAGVLTALGGAFCLKVGAGLGGALPMWIVHAGGYQAGADQSPTAVDAIVHGIVWLPAGCFALAALSTLFYARFERGEPRIRAELEGRRAAKLEWPPAPGPPIN